MKKPHTIDLQQLSRDDSSEFRRRSRSHVEYDVSSTCSSEADDIKARSEKFLMLNNGGVVEGQKKSELSEYSLQINANQLMDRDTDRFRSSRSGSLSASSRDRSPYTPIEAAEGGLRQTKADRVKQLISTQPPKQNIEQTNSLGRKNRSVSVDHVEDIYKKTPKSKIYKEDIIRRQKSETVPNRRDEDLKEIEKREQKKQKLARLVEMHDAGQINIKKVPDDTTKERKSLKERLGSLSKDTDEKLKPTEAKAKIGADKLERLMKMVEEHDQQDKRNKKSSVTTDTSSEKSDTEKYSRTTDSDKYRKNSSDRYKKERRGPDSSSDSDVAVEMPIIRHGTSERPRKSSSTSSRTESLSSRIGSVTTPSRGDSFTKSEVFEQKNKEPEQPKVCEPVFSQRKTSTEMKPPQLRKVSTELKPPQLRKTELPPPARKTSTELPPPSRKTSTELPQASRKTSSEFRRGSEGKVLLYEKE